MLTVRKIITELGCHLGGGIILDGSEEKEKKALREYNRLVRRLLKEGDTDASEVIMCLPVEDKCITLPSGVLAIEDAVWGECKELPIFPTGYQFCSKGANLFSQCCNPCGPEGLLDMGDGWPVQSDLLEASHILAFSDRPECDTAKITIQGLTTKGKEKYTFPEGKQKLGNTIPINHAQYDISPSITDGDQYSDGIFDSITSIQKTVSMGYVSVYGYNPNTHEVQWLTTLRPDEQFACFRRYKFASCPECPTIMKVRALLRFVEATRLDEVSLVQDLDALESMAKALVNFDDNEVGLYHAWRQESKAQLNKGKQRSKKHQKFKIKVAEGPGSVNTGSSRTQWRNW